MDKTIAGLVEPVAGRCHGATVMIGGFGGSRSPIGLIHALIDRFCATGTPRNPTVVNNNAGNGHVGLAALVEHGMASKLICSFPARRIRACSHRSIWLERSSLSWCRKARSLNASARAGLASPVCLRFSPSQKREEHG